jgi:penicillin G amidase
MFANTRGTIAWQAVGATPIRPNWNGLVPVPGDGRFEWAGFRTLEDLPFKVDPVEGFVATANEMNLPTGWDHAAPGIGYEWIDKSRAERIQFVLREDEAHTLEASCALQNDLHSLTAARGCTVVAAAELTQEAAHSAQAWLDGWDHVSTSTSSPAAL